MTTHSNNAVPYELHVHLGLGKAAAGISLATLLNYSDSDAKIIAITRPNDELNMVEDSEGFCNIELVNTYNDRLQIYRLKFFHSKQMSFDEFVQTLPSGVVGVTQSTNISEINAVLRSAKSISSCLGPQGLAAYAKPDLLANSAAKIFYFFENDTASCDAFEKVTSQGNSSIDFQRVMINRVVDSRKVVGNTIRFTASTVGTVSLYDPLRLFKDEPTEYNQLILRRCSNKSEVDLEKAIKHKLFNNIHAYATLYSFHNIQEGNTEKDWASLNSQNFGDIDLIIKSAKAALQKDFFMLMLNNKHFHSDCEDMLSTIIQVAPLTIERLFPSRNEAKIFQRTEQFNEICDDLKNYLSMYPEFSIEIKSIENRLKANWDKLMSKLI